MSWEWINAELNSECTLETMEGIKDIHDSSTWYCDDCGDSKEPERLLQVRNGKGEMMGVLCRSCTIKLYRKKGMKVPEFPVTKGQTRLF